jgi:hypothetical protein
MSLSQFSAPAFTAFSTHLMHLTPFSLFAPHRITPHHTTDRLTHHSHMPLLQLFVASKLVWLILLHRNDNM